MFILSGDKLQSIINRIEAIIDLQDEEIKKYALLAIVEELEEIKVKKELDE